MIFVPTRRRPESLRRLAMHYHITNATLPMLIIIDEDDNSYDIKPPEFPSNWSVMINKESRNLNAAINGAFEAYPNEPFYGIVADDIVPLTDSWDVKMAAAAGKHNIAWADDSIQGPMLPTHSFIGGDLVRAWGWFVAPYTNRHCADYIWKDFAEALGVGVYCPDIMLRHLHWQANTAPFDTTYAIQPSFAEGDKQYQTYKNSDQFKEDVKRVKEKLGI